tara:strand:+ start:743 stop:1477 length:735 start_codon:yes stop_codon:yes gene_type:complete
MELWAHRGSHSHSGLVENTLPAFEQALREGAFGIELDVHLSADGIPIVFHDETLDRLTQDGLKIPIAAVSSIDLASIALVGNAFIPTLADVLDLIGGQIPVNIELKDGVAVAAVSNVLKDLSYANALISSFDARAIAVAASMRPDLERAWISGDESSHPSWQYANWYPLEVLQRTQSTRWHTHGAFVRPSITSALARVGISTYVWTVNDLAYLARMEAHGVVGVFTDYPGLMKSNFQFRDATEP